MFASPLDSRGRRSVCRGSTSKIPLPLPLGNRPSASPLQRAGKNLAHGKSDWHSIAQHGQQLIGELRGFNVTQQSGQLPALAVERFELLGELSHYE